VKRRNDPTSAKVSTILGSYDKAKELVSSSRMIGAILQPATPRPPSSDAVPPPPAAAAARSGVRGRETRPQLSRQGVFEQFQPSAVSSSADWHAAAAAGGGDKKTTTHVVNGRHKSTTADSKQRRLTLAVSKSKVCGPRRPTITS